MTPKGKQKKTVRNPRSTRTPRFTETIAVIGYGSQGRAMALNLRDSGYPVVPGLRSRSKSRRLARQDGFTDVKAIRAAVESANVVCFAFPDHLHGRVFNKDIAPFLSQRSTLWFLHGTSIHFGFVSPPRHCDVILIAPHAPGAAVRREYLSERSITASYAIDQNSSGRARRTVSKLTGAAGIRKKNLIETSFEHEAIGDLFGEQAVLCGGLAMLIKTGFEVLVEGGLKPESAYLEVAHQLDLIVELIKKHGIEGMLARISPAARLGSVQAGPRIINRSTKSRMQQVFEDIRSGRFSRKLNRLTDREIAKINKALADLSDPRLEKAARKFSR